MNTIFEALRESHEIQRQLCRQLLLAKQTDKQDEIYKALCVELEAHAAAEERFLYAPILMDDMGLSSSRHALAEHHEIEECLEKLEELKTGEAAWREAAKELSKTVRHHLKEEETKFFQMAGKILTEAQKTKLIKPYLKDLQRLRKKLAQA